MLAQLFVLKLSVLLLLYLFLLAAIGLIYRDLALATGVRPEAETPRGQPAALLHPRLVVLESPGKQKGQFFEFSHSVTIGRDASCDIVLEDKAVSHHHARLFRQDTGFALEDLDSSNGTFLNTELVLGSTKVKPGDRIQIGQTLLEIVG